MFILASQSPRRKELLSSIIEDFEIIPSNVDESKYPLDQLSLVKANDISLTHPNDVIIAADTLVFLNNEVLGKPKNKEDAKQMLRKLSGNVHEVRTIYSIVCVNEKIEFTKTVTSKVYFKTLEDDLIDRYVESGSPLDKAGAYGIQDNKNFPIIENIEGSYTNIVGLPIEDLEDELENLGLLC